jgi:hypothetical protein
MSNVIDVEPDLSSRFHHLNAPAEFVPEQNIPLRWRCSHRHPDCVALYDPSASTGFVLRVIGDGVDVAFHLDGRVARMMVEHQVIDDADEQEQMLKSLLQ